MTDNVLNINFNKWAVMLIPPVLRKPFLVAFLKIAISQVGYLYTQFIKFRSTTNYRLKHNGQVCYLRAVLNDQFDPIDRQIEIGDAESRQSTLIYWRELERLVPDRYNPVLIVSSRGYTSGSGFDFIVKVPSFIYSNPALVKQLRAVVVEYKLASKQFDVVIK